MQSNLVGILCLVIDGEQAHEQENENKDSEVIWFAICNS